MFFAKHAEFAYNCADREIADDVVSLGVSDTGPNWAQYSSVLIITPP